MKTHANEQMNEQMQMCTVRAQCTHSVLLGQCRFVHHLHSECTARPIASWQQLSLLSSCTNTGDCTIYGMKRVKKKSCNIISILNASHREREFSADSVSSCSVVKESLEWTPRLDWMSDFLTLADHRLGEKEMAKNNQGGFSRWIVEWRIDEGAGGHEECDSPTISDSGN